MKKMLAQVFTGSISKDHKKNDPIEEILQHANSIRKSIISMLLEAGSGHSAGALGMADVFATLYFKILKHDPKNPSWEERDRLILSNGHICPVLYATLAEVGYFPKSELNTFRKFNSRLQGHPHYNSLPGVENTSGPLGQGLSQAIGIASVFKMDSKSSQVFCLMSDGEQQEGQVWEAYMYAANKKLGNLTVMIDNNNIQIGGYTKEIMSLEPLKNKLEAFGWNVLDIDGHDVKAILDACKQARETQTQPTAIICNTTPGKGVSFMENLPEWHGKPPNAQEAQVALEELNNSEINLTR